MNENKDKKTPFRDLTNALKEIRKRSISNEQINEINSIVEIEIEDIDSPAPLDKVASSSQEGDMGKWDY